MGLRSKLLLMLLGLLIIPLALLSGGGYWYFSSRFFDEALSKQRLLTKRINESVGYNLQRNLNFYRGMADNAHFLEKLLAYRGEPDRASALSLQRALREFLKLNSSLVEMAVYDTSGALESASVTGLVGNSTPLGFPLQVSGRLPAPGSYRMYGVDDAEGGRIFRLLLPVRSVESGDLGYLAMNINNTVLQRLVTLNQTEDLLLFFSNEEGKILSKSESIQVDELPQGYMQPALLAGNEETIAVEFNSHSYQMMLHPAANGLWFGTLLDKNALLMHTRNLLTAAFIAVAVLISVVVLIFYAQLARWIVRPIDQLIRATRTISAGNYEPDIPIRSGDEMGELADAFRVMGKQLGESNARVTQLAFYDPLTRLPNRETLRHSLQKMIETAARKHRMLGILFIDLDDFKKVNDRLGHASGDQLLVEVGNRLSRCLRGGDLISGGTNDFRPDKGEGGSLISRRGGDEFNAIINDVDSARDIAVVAERLITDINAPISLSGSPVSVGASVGVAIYPYDGEDADTLLRNADLAMYEAKRLGKNKYYLFTESINKQVSERLEMEQRIARGLKLSEFSLHFQPKIKLDTMQIGGFEALIRWQSPELGYVSPAQFIPLAEGSQLIYDLGRWIIAEAFYHIQQWHRILPPGVRVAINISARQLAQENFAENFLMLAREFQIDLQRIEIELTETSILTDEELVIDHLTRLRNAGVKVSLDDFGTGYSSLTFLRNLPIDSVKIDRSFVTRLEQDTESTEIVASLLDLCRKLSLDTVAEGLETSAQLDYLSRHGCREGQGFYFARPMPAAEVVNFVHSPSYVVM